MASSNTSLNAAAAPRRGRRVMVVPLARAALAEPPPQQALPPVAIGTPRSAFWQNNYDMLGIGLQQVEQLKGLGLGLSDISERIAANGVPTALSVTTQFDADDFALLERGVVAMESLSDAMANNGGGGGGGCEDVQDLSEAGFAAIARVVDLAVALLDRKGVDPRSVLAKLQSDGVQQRGEELAKDLEAAGADAAIAQKVRDAVALAPFDAWVEAGGAYDTDAFRSELRRRVLLLLAVKCWIAQHLHDEAPIPVARRSSKRAR